MKVVDVVERTWWAFALLAFILAPAAAGAAEAGCWRVRVEVREVRVYGQDIYANWMLRPVGHPPCPTVRTGVMLGRSPAALRPTGTPISEQRSAYSTFVPLDVPLEVAWIAVYAVDAKGTVVTSIPRILSGAVIIKDPAMYLPPEESRIDSCSVPLVALGIAPVSVDGFVSVHWRFKHAPCGFIETGVLMGPRPDRLARVYSQRAWESDFYIELPAPPGDTVWVVAYVIDPRGYEFRSAPEQVVLMPSKVGRIYNVEARGGVSLIFEHEGVIWSLMHESKSWNDVRSVILRRFPEGKWEVITSLFDEPIRWIRMLHVTAAEVMLISEDRVYSWRTREKTWSVQPGDYEAYFFGRRLPVGRSLAELHARRVRISERRYLFAFDDRGMTDSKQPSGVHLLSGSDVEKTFFLPQPTVADFKRHRPRDAGEYIQYWKGTGEDTLENGIGPHIFENGRLWFGITFYGGEGWTGIGGIGSFDPKTGRWSIHHHPLLTRSSVTALHPDGDLLWLGTLHIGERTNSPTSGLVRYNRRTKRAVSYLPKNSGICSWLITEIRRIGNELWVGTGTNGISVLNLAKGTWTNYAVAPNDAPPHQIRSLGQSCRGVKQPVYND